MSELIDELNGGVPDWFTDVHWIQLATEHHEASTQIDVLSPEYPLLEAKYRAGLGVSSTNNLWVWFTTKPQSSENDNDKPPSSYDLDAPVHDETPGIKELGAIRDTHSDLYAEVQSLCDEHSVRYGLFLDKLNTRQALTIEDFVTSTISLFKMRVGIEKVLDLLREQGVSEQTIGMLGR